MNTNRNEHIDTCKLLVSEAVKRRAILIHYIRNRKYLPIGVLVGYKNEEGVPNVGWALCNIKKERFNKYIGIAKAMDRAINGVPTDRDGEPLMPESVLKEMDNFIERCDRYFHTGEA